MAINKVENQAKITYGGADILSQTTVTALLLSPTITKVVDLLVAKIGDTLTYTCVVTNVSLTSIDNVVFSDALQSNCQYVAGSFNVNGSTVSPNYDTSTNTLTYTIPTIAALGVVTIVFKVNILSQ